MLNIVTSTAAKPNPDFMQSPRIKDENNTAWLERNLKKLAGESGAKGVAYLSDQRSGGSS